MRSVQSIRGGNAVVQSGGLGHKCEYIAKKTNKKKTTATLLSLETHFLNIEQSNSNKRLTAVWIRATTMRKF